MWFFDQVRQALRGGCEKLIHYQGRSLEFKGLGAQFAGVIFSMAEFGTHLETIVHSVETARALDDFQYLMCKMAQELDKNDSQRRQLFENRAAAVTILTRFRVTLEAFKTDPVGQQKGLSTM